MMEVDSNSNNSCTSGISGYSKRASRNPVPNYIQPRIIPSEEPRAKSGNKRAAASRKKSNNFTTNPANGHKNNNNSTGVDEIESGIDESASAAVDNPVPAATKQRSKKQRKLDELTKHSTATAGKHYKTNLRYAPGPEVYKISPQKYAALLAIRVDDSATVAAMLSGQWIDPRTGHAAAALQVNALVGDDDEKNEIMLELDLPPIWTTLLHQSSRYNAVKCMELLLDNNLDPNIRDDSESTALDEAAHYGTF
jgi:hypothetical protein